MKRKGFVVLTLIMLLLVYSGSVASAANWVYVGSQTFCTGETRHDYLDTNSVMKDAKAGTMIFWVRTEFTDEVGSFQKLSKYETKLGVIRRTRYLAWHMYVKGNLLMENAQPSDDWMIPEDITLLGKAVEMAYDVVQSQ